MAVHTKSVKTFTAEIFVGRKEGYFGEIQPHSVVIEACQKFCDEVSFGLSVEETQFIYRKGNEPGSIVRFINYPRYPFRDIQQCKDIALTLADTLLYRLKQERLSVVFSDETILLSAVDEDVHMGIMGVSFTYCKKKKTPELRYCNRSSEGWSRVTCPLCLTNRSKPWAQFREELGL